MHAHATTGLSTATITKAAEAGVDMVDAAISSMSMTTGHSATESVVSILEGTERDTGLDLVKLEEIAAYFRPVRKKYAKFEGTLKGVDSRILLAQVPGGMLSNMENQLREQNALDRMDDVLAEIPWVREDLGYIALVTPTSQIVGTQAVLNVLMGERYKTISKETSGVLRGEYGATPSPVNAELQARVLEEDETPMTCRPADHLEPEVDRLTVELEKLADEKGLKLADDVIDDVLTYALFPQVGLKFLENRNNPDAFEPAPTGEETKPKAAQPAAATVDSVETYKVVVNGTAYDVEVGPGGAVTSAQATPAPTAQPAKQTGVSGGTPLAAPMAGTISKVLVKPGQTVAADEVVIVMEAMKMETEVRTPNAGTVVDVGVSEGDAVQSGDTLLSVG